MAAIDKIKDIKIGGTLTTAAANNVLVHADEVFDEQWGTNGLNQSAINIELLNKINTTTSAVVGGLVFKGTLDYIGGGSSQIPDSKVGYVYVCNTSIYTIVNSRDISIYSADSDGRLQAGDVIIVTEVSDSNTISYVTKIIVVSKNQNEVIRTTLTEIGSTTKPVYVNEGGQVVACSRDIPEVDVITEEDINSILTI